jgi:hypothetical protein
VAPLLAAQDAGRGVAAGDPAWLGDAQRLTTLALMRLGYLGFGPEDLLCSAGRRISSRFSARMARGVAARRR